MEFPEVAPATVGWGVGTICALHVDFLKASLGPLARAGVLPFDPSSIQISSYERWVCLGPLHRRAKWSQGYSSFESQLTPDLLLEMVHGMRWIRNTTAWLNERQSVEIHSESCAVVPRLSQGPLFHLG